MTQELTTTSILSLFDTTKEQRESFALDLINRIDNGQVDPLKAHLQLKCMEDIIKKLNDNSNYKAGLLAAAEKMGGKSFQLHNAKFEIKEVGTKYDFSNSGDPVYADLAVKMEQLKTEMKARESFLKTVPLKGMPILIEDTGEAVTVFPPSKTSTTSVAVTLS